jgi:hypothetical protein
MDFTRPEDQQGWSAVERLLALARKDTGQARRVANLLRAWHSAAENGGWDPTDLWGVDDAIVDDMLTVLRLVRDAHRYPGGLGFEEEMPDNLAGLEWQSAGGDEAGTGIG